MSAKIAGGLFALWLLDYFCAVYLGKPYPFCLADALLRPVLSPWASLGLLAVGGYFFLMLVMGRVLSAAVAVFAMLLIAGGEGFANTLFSFGKSCA